MEIFFYIIIFIMGCYFGSFFTLAVYRIPKKENILYKHSYCPNCNHKLGMLDLIPILSYLFLGAKCRYCKNKIRPRYFLLEIFTGLVFLVYCLSLDFYNMILTKNNIFPHIIGILYISGLFIIAGIDKEKVNVNKQVMIYETSIVLIYLLFLLATNTISPIVTLIQVFILIILYLISSKKSKYERNVYIIDTIILVYLIYLYCSFKILILTLIFSLILIAFGIIKQRIRHKNKEHMPIAFYLSISNIIAIILFNLIGKF